MLVIAADALGRPLQRLTLGRRQPVQGRSVDRDHLVTGLDEPRDHAGPEPAGAAGHDHLHDRTPVSAASVASVPVTPAAATEGQGGVVKH